MAFLPGEHMDGLVAEASFVVPTWTHDRTGEVFELPDDIPFDLPGMEEAKNGGDIDYGEWLRAMAKYALGEEEFARLDGNTRQPMGMRRCKDLVSAWTKQVGLGDGGKSSDSGEPSENTDPPSKPTSPSSTGSTSLTLPEVGSPGDGSTSS